MYFVKLDLMDEINICYQKTMLYLPFISFLIRIIINKLSSQSQLDIKLIKVTIILKKFLFWSALISEKHIISFQRQLLQFSQHTKVYYVMYNLFFIY